MLPLLSPHGQIRLRSNAWYHDFRTQGSSQQPYYHPQVDPRKLLPDVMNNNCLVCDTPTNTRCAKCKSAYCSKAHIAQNWPVHKLYCKRVSAPGITSFDAILFAVNETKPRLIKLPYKRESDEDGLPWQRLDKEPWFIGEDVFVRNLFIGRLGMGGPPLGYTLAVKYDDNFLVNGSPINQCIINVTRGKAMHPWAGNLVALRSAGMQSDHYHDIVVQEDLVPLIRYFEDYGK